MTVGELIEMLTDSGDYDGEVKIRVSGSTRITEELDGTYHGVYSFRKDIEEDGEVYAVDSDLDGVILTVEVSG